MPGSRQTRPLLTGAVPAVPGPRFRMGLLSVCPPHLAACAQLSPADGRGLPASPLRGIFQRAWCCWFNGEPLATACCLCGRPHLVVAFLLTAEDSLYSGKTHFSHHPPQESKLLSWYADALGSHTTHKLCKKPSEMFFPSKQM